MTICSASSLVLVFSIIMCLSVQDHAEKVNGINCKIEKEFNSIYVTPMIEQPTQVTGCNLKSAQSIKQEIHVLRLLRPSIHTSDTKNELMPSVSLDIRPHWKEKSHLISTLIILLSDTPVRWQINLNHLENITNFHVIVNKPSYAFPSLPVQVLRRKLPLFQRLSSWIKSHHGPVTSFSLIPVANDATLFLGSDTHALAQECNFSSPVVSSRVKASFVQFQSSTGCTVKHPSVVHRKERVLYIIELESSAFNRDVSIHLYQTNSSQKNLTVQAIALVLKCHVPVEWFIKSTGIQGVLHIVAEYPVHIQTNPSLLTTVIQQKPLPNTTPALLREVEKSLGVINTYLKTSKANRINIILKDHNKYAVEGTPQHNFSSPEPTLNNENQPEVPEIIFATDSKKPHSVNNLAIAFDKQSLVHSLSEKMITNCGADDMSVIFPLQETANIFTSLLDIHSKLSSVTLIDESCKAKQNDSHIILEFGFHDCGTRLTRNGRHEYHNQVQFITTKYSSEVGSMPEKKHLPTDDDDYISEDGSGSDDLSSNLPKFYEEHIIYPLPFYCLQNLSSRKADTTVEKYELTLFSKKDFQTPLSPQKSPFNVVVYDHLFVEAKIKADPRLCINVDECWLSEEAKSSVHAGRSILIKQGCPTDLSANILSKSQCGNLNSDVEHHKMRFSFQLSEEFINQQVYLHCQMSSCAMRDSKQLNTKQCIKSENFCLKQSLRPYLDSLRGKRFSILVQGPIQVISKPHLDKDKEKVVLPIFIPETTSIADSFDVDYSFDKLTGNTKKNPLTHELVFVGLSTEAVVGIAFASFIIGAGLMATLWLIHMHTEPSRQVKHSRKSNQPQVTDPLNLESTDGTEKTLTSSLKPPCL